MTKEIVVNELGKLTCLVEQFQNGNIQFESCTFKIREEDIPETLSVLKVEDFKYYVEQLSSEEYKEMYDYVFEEKRVSVSYFRKKFKRKEADRFIELLHSAKLVEFVDYEMVIPNEVVLWNMLRPRNCHYRMQSIEEVGILYYGHKQTDGLRLILDDAIRRGLIKEIIKERIEPTYVWNGYAYVYTEEQRRCQYPVYIAIDNTN